MNGAIRVAVPSKGRLKAPALSLLEEAGLKVEWKERAYVLETSNPKFQAVLARAFDIPVYVQHGAASLGITGRDIILEREAEVYELLDLGFGRCKLVLAVPRSSRAEGVWDLPAGAKVATEFPNLARKFFEEAGKQVEILALRGGAELAPRLGLADAIIDLSTTGETLRRNGLKPIETILESTARLICNKVAYRAFRGEVEGLLERIKEAKGKLEG